MAVSMQGISYNPLKCCLSVTVSTTNPSAARDTLYDWLNDLALLPEVKRNHGSFPVKRISNVIHPKTKKRTSQ